MRVLMFLAANMDRLSTIAEIAGRFDISEAHLMKVVYRLGKAGFVETVRGRSGGMRLAGDGSTIRVGPHCLCGTWDFTDIDDGLIGFTPNSAVAGMPMLPTAKLMTRDER